MTTYTSILIVGCMRCVLPKPGPFLRSRGTCQQNVRLLEAQKCSNLQDIQDEELKVQTEIPLASWRCICESTATNINIIWYDQCHEVKLSWIFHLHTKLFGSFAISIVLSKHTIWCLFRTWRDRRSDTSFEIEDFQLDLVHLWKRIYLDSTNNNNNNNIVTNYNILFASLLIWLLC